ncbi:MAG: DUF4831 family protein [Prolixibacteraceae bacterium]|nr:DUF4831 family protein [Prolixibacteraceae bacterium]
MKQIKKITLLFLFVVFIIPVFAVNPGENNRRKEEPEEIMQPVDSGGIVYALPKTGFEITIEVEQTNYFPGPYAAFAKKYFGAEPLSPNPEESYKITSVSLNYVSEADPTAVFLCKQPELLPISLFPGGIIAGINIPVTESVGRICGSGLKKQAELPDVIFPIRSADDNYFIEVNSETGEETIHEKPLEEKAREAADYLFRLRRKMGYTILSPSDVVPEDGLGYKVFVEQARELEKEYVSLFLGKTFRNQITRTYCFYPNASNLEGEVLCRFSTAKGLLPISDISGKPLMITFEPEKIPAATIDSMNIATEPLPGDNGIFYRVPVRANVEISCDLNTLYSGKVTVGQLGTIIPVPSALLDGKYSITFDTFTGGLLGVESATGKILNRSFKN